MEIVQALEGEIRQAGAGRASDCAKDCGSRLRRAECRKSTLLNRLARREAAIVSPHAGTTRDVIEVHLDLKGFR